MLKARYYQNDGSEGKAQALPECLFDGVVHESDEPELRVALAPNLAYRERPGAPGTCQKYVLGALPVGAAFASMALVPLVERSSKDPNAE